MNEFHEKISPPHTPRDELPVSDRRRFTTIQSVAAGCLGSGLVLWATSASSGLSDPARVTFAVFVGMAIMWLIASVPPFAVGLIGLAVIAGALSTGLVG
jgi:di/tricarboxylate transporter